MIVLGALIYIDGFGQKKYYGIRVQVEEKMYDIDMDTCIKYNIEVQNLDTEIELFDNDGILCSKDELEKGIIVQNISEDIEVLGLLFEGRLDKRVTHFPTKDHPEYINGIAVAINKVVDIANEYQQIRLDYHITLFVDDNMDLTNICTVLGWRLPLEATLNAYNYGIRQFELTLSDKEFKVFNSKFEYKLHMLPIGLEYKYSNDYSGVNYDIFLKPVFFDLPLNTDFDYWTGSIAYGKSLKEVSDKLKSCLDNKDIICLSDTKSKGV